MLTVERLKYLLSYDSTTGIFVWLVTNSQRRRKDQIAGSFHKGLGYIFIGIDGKKYLAHRLAYLYMTGKWPATWIDHKDGNKTNNRWNNLRAASASQNIANSRRYKKSTSGYKGVSLCKDTNRWRATIKKMGIIYRLGRFDTPEEAHAAYCKAAQRLHGEFARGG